MTKPPSLKSSEIDQFENLDLHQLESKLKQIVTGPPSPESKRSARIVRQALRSRQRRIKAKVMEFEQSNNHHLLLFDSTENFSKIAGHSVLFYTLTIADRIHRRFSIKNDTDDYSRSEEGIVSIRSLSQLEASPASTSSPTASSAPPSFIFINFPNSTATNNFPSFMTAPGKISNASPQSLSPNLLFLLSTPSFSSSIA